MAKKYLIDGGFQLSGTIKPNGNKNAALPVIAASLLTDEECILRNIPDIEDVRMMLRIAEELGASIHKEDKNSYRIKGTISNSSIDQELGKKIRASILFAGPLLARLGNAELPPPGGDVIGRRRLDTHFLAFQELGSGINATHKDFIKLTASKLLGKEILLDEASVTGTENIIMSAVLAQGDTTIINAAVSHMFKIFAIC